MQGSDRKHRAVPDRIAARFDETYATPYWRFYREVSWRHLKAFLPASRPAWTADLGCGTGWFGARLLEAGLYTLFLDPSAEMLDPARAREEVRGGGAQANGRPGSYSPAAQSGIGEAEAQTAGTAAVLASGA